MFFTDVLHDITLTGSVNEKTFQDLKTELLNPYGHVDLLLGEERYERFIRMQLKNNNNRTQALNFLINALPQYFLLQDMKDMYINIRLFILKEFFVFNDNGTIKSIDDEKLKSILDHIHTELNKCNGNETGKNNFRSRIKDYFLKDHKDTILNVDDIFNNFTTEVLSDCQK
ncbi:hypothetical protein bcCo53_001448 (plasmid) [Borrelia coriaceae]|uniref:Mlp lipoprotein family protein n=1 Tax=Borrelia coriaceae ATCC 43381 TaxID=1408429 RepID=W5SWZ6_9SPIR|nr:Mlp family lipoprotein [Borrelia coriaceae]AHH11724.1 Mlp lipoprotein family protein [Borrelia coriaceae ATCC 43381]UPA17270.1 hypothetical protein bcCo53_001448 [Borrelia coriaceae]